MPPPFEFYQPHPFPFQTGGDESPVMPKRKDGPGSKEDRRHARDAIASKVAKLTPEAQPVAAKGGASTASSSEKKRETSLAKEKNSTVDRIQHAGPSAGRTPASRHGSAAREGAHNERPHGKDAKLALQVAHADALAGSGSDVAGKAFDPKAVAKKAVFRPILMSPYKAEWYVQALLREGGGVSQALTTPKRSQLLRKRRPEVAHKVAQALQYTLVDLLRIDAVQRRHFQRSNGAMPRQSARKTKDKNRRRKARLLLGILEQHGIVPSISKARARDGGPGAEAMETEDAVTKAPVSKPILCGLNCITRQLESYIQRQLPRSSAEARLSGADAAHAPSVIFVCTSDVDPPALTAHFPMLVAAYNATVGAVSQSNESSETRRTYLVRLPQGAEETLADAVGLRRCSALSVDASRLSDAFSADEQGDDVARAVQNLMKKLAGSGVAPMQLAWLDAALASVQPLESTGKRNAPAPTSSFLEPRIKHVRTSAPADMNAIKGERRARRTERKARRKQAASVAAQRTKKASAARTVARRRRKGS